MGTDGAVLIHYNPRLAHQIEFAEALKKGFDRHGDHSHITPRINMIGWMHVVLGPHYAKDYWLYHPRCLLLDRCHVGDPKRVVSLAWLVGGAADYRKQSHRRFTKHYEIKIKPWRTGSIRRVLVLGDYDYMPKVDLPGCAMMYREHPAKVKPLEPLPQVLDRVDMVIGHSTTALIEAVLHGVPIVCTQLRNVCRAVSGTYTKPYRVNTLSWANWHHDEIQTGVAWEYLKQHVDYNDYPAVG
jgi:hypothetical protein